MSQTEISQNIEVCIQDKRYNLFYNGIMKHGSLEFKSSSSGYEYLELIIHDRQHGEIEVAISNKLSKNVNVDMILDFFKAISKELSHVKNLEINIKLDIEIEQASNVKCSEKDIKYLSYPVILKMYSLGKNYVFKYNIAETDIIIKNSIIQHHIHMIDNAYKLFLGGDQHNPHAHQQNNITPRTLNVPTKTCRANTESKRTNCCSSKQILIDYLKEELTELENDPSDTIVREDIFDIIENLINLKGQLMK